MSLQNALRFISEISENVGFREILEKMKQEKVTPFLDQEGYKFTEDEFEDAVRSLLLKCQFESQADYLHELSMWYRILIHS